MFKVNNKDTRTTAVGHVWKLAFVEIALTYNSCLYIIEHERCTKHVPELQSSKVLSFLFFFSVFPFTFYSMNGF